MATTTSKLGLPRPEASDNVTLENEQTLIDAIDNAAASQAELDAHVGDNTAHVTASERAVWHAKETPAGAKAKADAAEQAAKSYADGKFAKKTVSLADGIDLNTVSTSGFYRLGPTYSNGPSSVGYGQLIVSRGSDTIYQIITGISDNEFYMRQGVLTGPTWQPWRKLWHNGNLPDPVTKTWAQSLGLGAVLSAAEGNVDWNTITETGFYTGNINSPVANNQYFGIHVQHSSTYAYQEVARDGKLFSRWKESDNWSNWTEMWHSANLPNPVQTNVENAFTRVQQFNKDARMYASNLAIVSPSSGGWSRGIFFYDTKAAHEGADSSAAIGAYGNADTDTFNWLYMGYGNSPYVGNGLRVKPNGELYSFNGSERKVWHTGSLRTTSGYLEWNDNGSWKAVGGVKNVQRGNVAGPAASSSVDVTISGVNTSKSFVTFNNIVDSSRIRAELINSTTLSIINEDGYSKTGLTFSWEVIEYN